MSISVRCRTAVLAMNMVTRNIFWGVLCCVTLIKHWPRVTIRRHYNRSPIKKPRTSSSWALNVHPFNDNYWHYRLTPTYIRPVSQCRQSKRNQKLFWQKSRNCISLQKWVSNSRTRNYIIILVNNYRSMSIYQFMIAVRQQDGQQLMSDTGETTR